MIVTVKRSLSAQDLTGYDVPAEFAARHGGRTDVTTERPGRVALYQALVAVISSPLALRPKVSRGPFVESGVGSEGAVMQVVEMRGARGGTEGFHGHDLGGDDGR